MDGDGKTDLVSRHPNSLTDWDVCKSTGSQFSCTPWSSGPRSNSPQGADDIWQLADFDGDGKADLVYVSNVNNNYLILQRSTGSNFLPPEAPAFAGWPGAFTPGAQPSAVGDFDGDGRVDLALYFGDYKWKFCQWNGSQFVCGVEVLVDGPDQQGTFAPKAGFDFVVGDFNGDGRADIAWHANNSNQWRVCFSTSQPASGSQLAVFAFDCYRNGATIQSPAIWSNADTAHVADFNGDGMADLMAPEFNGTTPTGRWEVCMSKGDGTFNCIYPTVPTVSRREDATLGDFNGDGRTDIALRTASGAVRICLSTGTGFDCGDDPANPVWPGISNAADALENLRFGDFNGDGKTDIAAWESGATWAVGLAAGSPPDLIRKITNGLNVVTSFVYKPLTDSGIYAKDIDAVYPEIDIQSPTYVVTTMESSTMAAPPEPAFYDTFYSYRGLKGHALGAGMAGFKKRATSDPQSHMCAETETETNWAERRVGLVKIATKRYVSSAGVSGASGTCTGAANEISRVTNTWTMRKANTWTAGLTDTWQNPSQILSIFEVFLTDSTEQKWDLNRAELPTSEMTTRTVSNGDPLANIDVFGNQKLVKTSTWLPSTPDEQYRYRKTTASSFLNNTNTWIVGRVLETSVSNALPYTPANSGNSTRLSRFTYDGNTGLLSTETIEPNRSGTSEYLVTTYAYDSFGNRQSVRVQGLGVDRTTNLRYCNGSPSLFCASDGRFPTYVQNALGHEETRTFDMRFGLARDVTGPNVLTTHALYDKLGRKYCETRPDFSTTGWTWTEGGDGGAYYATTRDSAAQDPATNPNGVVSEQHFDALSREVALKTKAFDGTFAATKSTYDGRGRKSKVVKPSGGTLAAGSTEGTWTFGFDDLNRVISENGPEGYVSTSTYNGVKSSVTVAGQSGSQTTVRTINPRGEIIDVEDARQSHLRLQYDYVGNLELKTVTPGLDGLADGVAMAPATTIRFNVRGQKTRLEDPDQRTPLASKVRSSSTTSGE